MKFRFNNNMPKILVIGSCHLDIFADFPKQNKKYLDKPGLIHFSIGGTAFNLAANLAKLKACLSVLTVLKLNSVIADIIEYKVDILKIDIKHVIHLNADTEGGFVAFREDGDLISAVTGSLIENYVFDVNKVTCILDQQDIIILDCNLSERQLCEIVAAKTKNKKRFFVSAVSDSKVRRIRALENFCEPKAIELLSMNISEAHSLGIDDKRLEIDRDYRVKTLEKLRTEEICITRGREGLVYIQSDMNVVSFPAPSVSNIISTSGAGDSVLSSIIEWKIRDEKNIENLRRTINENLTKVLGSMLSNTSSEDATENFLRLKRKQSFIIKIGSNAIIFNYVTLALGIIGIGISIIGTWFAGH
jgi:sugar/nucleoside kinase (ribokinase family)